MLIVALERGLFVLDKPASGAPGGIGGGVSVGLCALSTLGVVSWALCCWTQTHKRTPAVLSFFPSPNVPCLRALAPVAAVRAFAPVAAVRAPRPLSAAAYRCSLNW